MKLTCPDCKRQIHSSDINVATDLAKCGKCQSLHKVSELAISQEELQLPEPPKGSKIQVRKGMRDEAEFFVPAKGWSGVGGFQLIFPIFWIGFITFWTFGAAQRSVFFALFSIPFWIVGGSMILGFINTVKETQELKITRDKLRITKNRPYKSTASEYLLSDIQKVRLKMFKATGLSVFSNFRHLMKMQKSFGSGFEMPAILSGTETEYFFEEASEAEQEWITEYLNAVVQRRKKTNAR